MCIAWNLSFKWVCSCCSCLIPGFVARPCPFVTFLIGLCLCIVHSEQDEDVTLSDVTSASTAVFQERNEIEKHVDVHCALDQERALFTVDCADALTTSVRNNSTVHSPEKNRAPQTNETDHLFTEDSEQLQFVESTDSDDAHESHSGETTVSEDGDDSHSEESMDSDEYKEEMEEQSSGPRTDDSFRMFSPEPAAAQSAQGHSGYSQSNMAMESRDCTSVRSNKCTANQNHCDIAHIVGVDDLGLSHCGAAEQEPALDIKPHILSNGLCTEFLSPSFVLMMSTHLFL